MKYRTGNVTLLARDLHGVFCMFGFEWVTNSSIAFEVLKTGQYCNSE